MCLNSSSYSKVNCMLDEDFKFFCDKISVSYVEVKTVKIEKN